MDCGFIIPCSSLERIKRVLIRLVGLTLFVACSKMLASPWDESTIEVLGGSAAVISCGSLKGNELAWVGFDTCCQAVGTVTSDPETSHSQNSHQISNDIVGSQVLW